MDKENKDLQVEAYNENNPPQEELDSAVAGLNDITTFLPIRDFLITNLLVFSSSTLFNFDIFLVLIIIKLFVTFILSITSRIYIVKVLLLFCCCYC